MSCVLTLSRCAVPTSHANSMNHVESYKHARKFAERAKTHSQHVSFCQLPAESRNLPRLVLQDMTVVKHRVRSDHGVELLLSETCGDKRSAWVSEGSVQKALRDEYFNQAGQARRKQRKKSHAPTGPIAEGDSWPSLLIPESAPQAVTCATHKEAGSDARDLWQRVAASEVLLLGCGQGGRP